MFFIYTINQFNFACTVAFIIVIIILAYICINCCLTIVIARLPHLYFTPHWGLGDVVEQIINDNQYD